MNPIIKSEQDQYQIELREAIDAADDALHYLKRARRALGSARGWGLYDMFAGGFFSTLFKHGGMNEAEKYMNKARHALQSFQKELDDVDGMIDIHFNRTDLLTFADYFWDGFLADFLMQGRIKEAIRNVDATINEVKKIRNALKSARKR